MWLNIHKFVGTNRAGVFVFKTGVGGQPKIYFFRLNSTHLDNAIVSLNLFEDDN